MWIWPYNISSNDFSWKFVNFVWLYNIQHSVFKIRLAVLLRGGIEKLVSWHTSSVLSTPYQTNLGILFQSIHRGEKNKQENLMWVPEINFTLSGLAASVFTCWDISLAPKKVLLLGLVILQWISEPGVNYINIVWNIVVTINLKLE